MAVRNCGFQAAVEMLEPFAGAGGLVVAPPVVPAVRLAHEQPTENAGGLREQLTKATMHHDNKPFSPSPWKPIASDVITLATIQAVALMAGPD